MVLSVLNEFDFFSTVPLGGSITYGEIAHQTTLPESMVRRILRHAMTMKFFEEKPPGSGRVAHTSPTAFMAKNSTWRSWLAHNLEEVRPGTVYVPMALKKFHAGNIEPTEDILKAGFAIADFDGTGSPTSFWDYLIRTPEGKQDGYRDHRFSEAMQAVAEASAVKTEVLLTTAFDWSSLGEATVVDVG